MNTILELQAQAEVWRLQDNDAARARCIIAAGQIQRAAASIYKLRHRINQGADIDPHLGALTELTRHAQEAVQSAKSPETALNAARTMMTTLRKLARLIP